jgi:hypothetical protein
MRPLNITFIAMRDRPAPWIGPTSPTPSGSTTGRIKFPCRWPHRILKDPMMPSIPSPMVHRHPWTSLPLAFFWSSPWGCRPGRRPVPAAGLCASTPPPEICTPPRGILFCRISPVWRVAFFITPPCGTAWSGACTFRMDAGRSFRNTLRGPVSSLPCPPSSGASPGNTANGPIATATWMSVMPWRPSLLPQGCRDGKPFA